LVPVVGRTTQDQLGSGIFLLFTARQIIFGILAGLLIGFLGVRFISWGDDSGWMLRGFQKIC
jgi:NhaP-type Na+/H+ or K+/H+ antiporter